MQAAAAAGYGIISLDAFADADTQRTAEASYMVQYSQNHFDAVDFEHVLNELDITHAIGLVYGGGFEAVPDLLEMVEKRMPLIGNSSRVMRNLKRPRQFFMLLDILKIPHPEVSFKPLIVNLKQSASGWLYKQGGGCGGTHIRKALPLPGIAPETGCYFQREVQGVPVSLLFVADGKQAREIGFNQQWISATPATPYRYGGAVGNADLPDSIKQQLNHAAQQLTNAVGLRGLNSLDAIMEGEQLWVLEVNPRLSATFDLYQFESCNLFELHLRASAGDMSNWLKTWPQPSQKAKAHHIIYAPYNLDFSDKMEWPDWVADLPLQGSFVEAHKPVCTVLAEAGTAEDARELVLSRARTLETTLENHKTEASRKEINEQ